MAVHLKALLEKTQILHPSEVEDKTCPVCLEDYLQNPSKEFPRKLPCGHFIGTECLLLWASSQTHATSINCPWCMRPIVHPIDAQYLQTVISAYVEAGVEQLAAKIAAKSERAITAVDRALLEHRLELLSLAIVLALPRMYFDTIYALIPLRMLLMCVELAIERNLDRHPRHGMVLMGLGLCLGSVYETRLGHFLIRCGRSPFKAAITGAYSNHTRLVLGVALVVFLAQAAWKHSATDIIAAEALWHFFGCSLHYYLPAWG